jgi:glycosyltransferase 2 family protein
MKPKRLFLYLLVFALLVVLFYLQFRTWRAFDWERFGNQTGRAFRGWGLVHVLLGVAFTYFAYLMRAIRWKIFLRPVKHTTTTELIAPTIIGFTGISLLGRLGEMIRPYLIARKVQLPFSSQLAVWTVERIFDFGGFAILLISAIFFSSDVKALKYYGIFRQGGLLLVVFVAALAIVMWIISAKGEFVATWVEGGQVAGFRHKLAARVREFRIGLNTIHGFSELLQLIAVSVAMWYLIAHAYHQVILSYGTPLQHVGLAENFLLIFASMLGSLVQLPGVGGGSQLGTITTLQRVFDVPQELAASCGILLWMVTFMSVVPLGLTLAHRERLSLRTLSKESQVEERLAET